MGLVHPYKKSSIPKLNLYICIRHKEWESTKACCFQSEKCFIAEERQLKTKFRMLEEAVAEYQKELENYSDRRRRYRDIVEHLQLGASLIKR